jgi:hypothetical protein
MIKGRWVTIILITWKLPCNRGLKVDLDVMKRIKSL